MSGALNSILGILLGNGRNAIVETAGAFMENSEAGAARDATGKQAALQQFAAEFGQSRKGWFDRIIDGLNRLPRPMLAFGTLGLFVSAMVDPIWFAGRMQGIALVPEPLWWLMGAIVSFYFGARHQAKGQEFQRSIAETMNRAPEVTRNIAALEALNNGAQVIGEAQENAAPSDNPALRDWMGASNGG